MPTYLDELSAFYPNVPVIELEGLLNLLRSGADDTQAWQGYVQAKHLGQDQRILDTAR